MLPALFCPVCEYKKDWGLEDPTGKSDEEFISVVKAIEGNIKLLKEKIRKQG